MAKILEIALAVIIIICVLAFARNAVDVAGRRDRFVDQVSSEAS